MSTIHEQDQVDDSTQEGTEEELEAFLALFPEEMVAAIDDEHALVSIDVRFASGVAESRVFDVLTFGRVMTNDELDRAGIVVVALFDSDLDLYAVDDTED